MPLLSFQAEDVEQLKSKRSRLIGNEPGTGKTYEGIYLDQLNRSGDGNAKVDLSQLFPPGKGKKTLVVAPLSVVGSWDQHLDELTEVEDIYVVDPKNRHVIMRHMMNPKTDGYFVVNWEFIRLELDDLKKVFFFHIIADEVHRAKNRKAQQTRALKQLTAVYKTAMSGTPADNKPQDLWSILNWLWPNYYGSFWRFVKAYLIVTEEEKEDGTGYRKIEEPNPNTIHILHEEMKPWFVRRLKKDVLPDLPDKYYSRLWVDLGPKQRRAYDQMKKTMVSWVDEHSDALEAGDPIIANAVVSQLVRLQQFAAGYLVPLLDEDGEQVIKYRKKVDKRSGRVEMIEVPQWRMTDPSAKLDALMEFMEDRPNDQIIVFSQFKTAVNLLAARMDDKAIPYGLLTGDVKRADRDINVRAFQDGRARVFAGTIAAGGEGITLTASSTVVFLDRLWSPSKNGQAEDRAHRIGQQNGVEIVDIMARNTVDLGKASQLGKKNKWLKMILGDRIDPDMVVKEIQSGSKDSSGPDGNPADDLVELGDL